MIKVFSNRIVLTFVLPKEKIESTSSHLRHSIDDVCPAIFLPCISFRFVAHERDISHAPGETAVSTYKPFRRVRERLSSATRIYWLERIDPFDASHGAVARRGELRSVPLSQNIPSHIANSATCACASESYMLHSRFPLIQTGV